MTTLQAAEIFETTLRLMGGLAIAWALYMWIWGND